MCDHDECHRFDPTGETCLTSPEEERLGCRHCRCKVEGFTLFSGKLWVHDCRHDHDHPAEPDLRLNARWGRD